MTADCCISNSIWKRTNATEWWQHHFASETVFKKEKLCTKTQVIFVANLRWSKTDSEIFMKTIYESVSMEGYTSIESQGLCDDTTGVEKLISLNSSISYAIGTEPYNASLGIWTDTLRMFPSYNEEINRYIFAVNFGLVKIINCCGWGLCTLVSRPHIWKVFIWFDLNFT